MVREDSPGPPENDGILHPETLKGTQGTPWSLPRARTAQPGRPTYPRDVGRPLKGHMTSMVTSATCQTNEKDCIVEVRADDTMDVIG